MSACLMISWRCAGLALNSSLQVGQVLQQLRVEERRRMLMCLTITSLCAGLGL